MGASQKTKAAKNSSSLNKDVKYKKPSCAPKRFKSAYMFYSERKHKELRQREECKKMRTADVAKLVSRAWKGLPSCERIVFLDMAKKDKERYEVEKANYKGPWKVIDVKDRAAPKRPMSAFLAFSNARRKEVTEANPLLSNGAISKILGDMWRDAPAEQKQFYQNEENKLRQQYKRRNSRGSKSGASSPIIDCVSVSSSQKNSSESASRLDDDDETLGCFEVMLDSLDEESSDVMSNSSRDYSISDNTARVTLPDDFENDMNFMPTQYASDTIADSIYLTNQPGFDAPYPLQPLISTDFGGFLAAAAMLDSSCEPFLLE